MFATKQDLLSFKEENLKLKENFKTFLKKHEQNKKYIAKDKVKELVAEQEILIDKLNQQIDKIIVKDENQSKKTTDAGALSKKRKPSEILKIESKKSRIEPEIIKNSLENFINNAGLQHLAERIFLYLNFKDLKACQLINRSSQSILANPRFWLQKFIQNGMTKKNQTDWIKAIQLTRDTEYESNLQLYLKRSFGMAKLVDIPCYIDEFALHKASDLIEKFRLKKYSIISSYLSHLGGIKESEFENVTPGCFQALVAKETKISNLDSSLLIKFFARAGDLNSIKVFTPLLRDPLGTEDKFTYPSIYYASMYGHLEIVKFLVLLSDNLNVNLNLQIAEIAARYYRHDNIVKYLNSIIESQ